MINALAGLGWQPASHQVRSRRPSQESFRVEMGAEQDAIAAEYIRTSVDVSAAAAAVSNMLEEDEQRVSNVLDALFMRPPSIEGDEHDGDVHAHVWERDELVGEIPSSELLTLDEQARLRRRRRHRLWRRLRLRLRLRLRRRLRRRLRLRLRLRLR